MNLFLLDLETCIQQEAERRLRMLGEYAHKEYTPKQLLVLARERYIPRHVLITWKYAFARAGISGLRPRDWTLLSEKAQQIVISRVQSLGDLANALTITEKDIRHLAQKPSFSQRKAERLVRRYRIGGLWGLAPERNPEKKRRDERVPSELTAKTEEAIFDEIDRWRNLLGQELFKKALYDETISDEEVIARADALKVESAKRIEEGEDPAKWKGISRSRLWDYIRSVKLYKSKGLAPKKRADSGGYHNLSERMEHIICGLRLSKRDITLQEVHEEAKKRARALGEPEPSYWHVRVICHNIPKEILAISDGRERLFRNQYRTTHKQWFDGNYVVYQLDATQVDVLVKDTREEGYRKKRGEVRPWITLCLESSTNTIVAARFSYEPPNKYTVAVVIRDALLQDGRIIGGIPDELRVDRGKAMISRHVQQIAADLGIDLHPCYLPEHKGKVERIFGMLNTRLWARLEGYVHSNEQERNPKVKAVLTLPELVQKFWEFVEQYHQELLEDTGKSRLETWAESCLTTPVRDPQQLDSLLEVICQRVVGKQQIQYATRFYWNDELVKYVHTGDVVVIHAAPEYTRPDDIEIYDLEGQKLCTATACDSEMGKEVTGKEVAEAQRRQRARAQLVIREERARLKAIDQQIEQDHSNAASSPAQISQGGTMSDIPQAPTVGTEGLTPSRQKNSSVLSSQKKKKADRTSSSSSPTVKKPAARSAWERLVRLDKQYTTKS